MTCSIKRILILSYLIKQTFPCRSPEIGKKLPLRSTRHHVYGYREAVIDTDRIRTQPTAEAAAAGNVQFARLYS